MKKALLFAVVYLLVVACAPTYTISKTDFDNIPVNANKVIITVPYSADSLYGIIAKTLSRDGWPIRSDKTSMQINSDGKSIGGGTNLKLVAYIESNPSGSSAYFTGQWGLDAQGQIMMQAVVNQSNYGFQEVVFNKKGTTKPDLAFQQMVLLAKQIPNGVISYNLRTLSLNNGFVPLSGKYPTNYTSEIGSPFNIVWDNVVRFCQQRNIPIKAIDKTSGLIIAENYIVNPISYSFENPDGSIQLLNADFAIGCEKIGSTNKCLSPDFIKTDLNFKVKSKESSTELTIWLSNISGNGKNTGEYYSLREVKSTGVFEKKIISQIKQSN